MEESRVRTDSREFLCHAWMSIRIEFFDRKYFADHTQRVTPPFFVKAAEALLV
jgi:hypothetical protein